MQDKIARTKTKRLAKGQRKHLRRIKQANHKNITAKTTNPAAQAQTAAQAD